MRNHEKEPRKNSIRLIAIILFCCSCVSSVFVFAEDGQEDAQKLYTRKGADTCLKCHDEDYKYPIFPIFYNKHGNRNDPRSPMAQLQCESCHGPGRAHATEPNVGYERAPIISFGRGSSASKDKQNGQCLQCHNDHGRQNWVGSAHERQDMLCVDCHTLHKRQDPILQVGQQSEHCYTCHKTQRAEFARTSVHPVRYQKMECSQCHNPHGTITDAMLKTNTKNETCYRCHAEKRGPYLWTHAPVQENCGLCHEHHGSINKPLLKMSVPLLCQLCHTSGHSNPVRDGSAITANSPFVLAKGCLNCHSQVHGSNHPSGVKFMR